MLDCNVRWGLCLWFYERMMYYEEYGNRVVRCDVRLKWNVEVSVECWGDDVGC